MWEKEQSHTHTQKGMSSDIVDEEHDEESERRALLATGVSFVVSDSIALHV